MSKPRKERLKQLEKERDHFYRNRSSHLISSDQPESSADEDLCFVDLTGLKNKLDTSKGRHVFVEEVKPSSSAPAFVPMTQSSPKYPEPQQRPQKVKVDGFDRLVAKETKARSKVVSSNVVSGFGQDFIGGGASAKCRVGRFLSTITETCTAITEHASA
jgi:hypothetical protein